MSQKLPPIFWAELARSCSHCSLFHWSHQIRLPAALCPHGQDPPRCTRPDLFHLFCSAQLTMWAAWTQNEPRASSEILEALVWGQFMLADLLLSGSSSVDRLAGSWNIHQIQMVYPVLLESFTVRIQTEPPFAGGMLKVKCTHSLHIPYLMFRLEYSQVPVPAPSEELGGETSLKHGVLPT